MKSSPREGMCVWEGGGGGGYDLGGGRDGSIEATTIVGRRRRNLSVCICVCVRGSFTVEKKRTPCCPCLACKEKRRLCGGGVPVFVCMYVGG
jgi:hypothetical protein